MNKFVFDVFEEKTLYSCCYSVSQNTQKKVLEAYHFLCVPDAVFPKVLGYLCTAVGNFLL